MLVSIQSLPAAEKPELCTVGAVFPGLPGYRPSMKGRLPNNGERDASACASKASPTGATEQIRMLNIQKTVNNTGAVFTLEGDLDTSPSQELEKALQETLPGLTELTLGFAALDYISSAGLRVLLTTQKIMNKQGGMIVKNVNKDISEIFELTGFSDVLTIR